MSAEVRFSRSLYRLDAVEQAAEAFGGVGRFEIAVDGQDIRVSLGDLHPKLTDQLDRIVDEFCNRALYGTILGERGGAS